MPKPGPLCHKCPLQAAEGPVWGEGPANAKLVIVGQCPGNTEISTGSPFAGSSGGILDRSLARVGWDRSRTFITNSVKCFVAPRHPVPHGAIRCCAPLLQRELDSLEAHTTILTLGQEAFNGFTGKKMLTISPPRSIKKAPDPDNWLRGAVYEINPNKAIIPAAHPAFIASTGFRDITYFDVDVAKAVRSAKGNRVRIDSEHLSYNPSVAEVNEYVELIEATGDFGLDYETPEKSAVEEEEELMAGGPTNIQVAGISHAPGWCVGVPGDMLSLLKPLFTRKRRDRLYCRVFNWGFEGYHTERQFGELTVTPIDLMLQLNRYYSDLKRKDLGTALSLFTDLPYTKNWAKTQPDRYNAYDTFGCLMASRKAEDAMKVLNIWEPLMTADMPLYNWVIECKNVGINCDVQHAQKLEIMMGMALDQFTDYWSKTLPMVDWQSSQQLIAMFAALGLPQVMRKRVGKDKSVKMTPSCDQEVLEMYHEKHQNPIAGLLLTMRSLKKASDFTRIYSPDGRSHPSHKIHGQKAGRIQAKNPDLQNIPEELAGIYPRTIIIPDDPDKDVIISGDFDAAEFYIYGFAANDIPILNCRKEGIYIYGMFYEEIFKKPFFEPGKPPKKAFRRKDIAPWELLVAKSGPLGLLYGRTAKSLQDGFGIERSFANRIYDSFFKEHWAVAGHHGNLIAEVTRNGFLRNFFDRIRWFPNIAGMKSEILSYTGQSNLADILIRSLNELFIGVKNFGGRLLFPVHDSIQISCPRRAVEGCLSFAQETMEQPWRQMKNFWIPATFKVGSVETSTTGRPNWGDTMVWEDWFAQYSRTARSLQNLSERTSP